MSDLVNFEIAKRLKEKGFDWVKITTYNPKTKVRNNHLEPTISQVLKWLRDKFFLHISTKPYPCEDGLMWMYEIRKFNNHIVFVVANKTGFVKEEEASLAGIEYVLDNLL